MIFHQLTHISVSITHDPMLTCLYGLLINTHLVYGNKYGSRYIHQGVYGATCLIVTCILEGIYVLFLCRHIVN